MPAGKYFAYAAEMLKLHPPHLTDQPILARMKRIGLEPGKSFDLDKVDPASGRRSSARPAAAQKLMAWKVPTLARVANGWSMNTDTMGVYGNYYLKRAIVAQFGLGANLPEDAIYPLNLVDEDGKPLDGANNYVLHFEKDDAAAGGRLLVGHAVRRRGLPGRQPAQPVRGQQLDAVQVQRRRLARPLHPERQPGRRTRKRTGCRRREGPFNLTMRLYAPRQTALDGRWNPPPLKRVEGTVGAGQQ